MSHRLPKGYFPDDWENYDTTEIYIPPEEEKPLTKKCECGMNVTWGYEVPGEFHSDWCPIYIKEDR